MKPSLLMYASDQSEAPEPESLRPPRRLALLDGGADGNEQLTTLTGAILIVLLAVIGITILRIGQLLWVHLFVGLVLLGPVAVKMASTGYRFFRYYARHPSYRSKGPPVPFMRVIAPVVVASTVLVLLTGVLLLITGPGGRGEFLLAHKASFIVWLPFTGLHVLGHLPALGLSLRPMAGYPERLAPSAGSGGRWMAVGAGLLVGLVVAAALIPMFAPWTGHTALLHGEH